jgi:hypothetical protein
MNRVTLFVRNWLERTTQLNNVSAEFLSQP